MFKVTNIYQKFLRGGPGGAIFSKRSLWLQTKVYRFEKVCFFSNLLQGINKKSPPWPPEERVNGLLHPGGINLFALFFYLLPFTLLACLFS
jgi:hypothetical protein